ncbi:MAG: NAD(P)-binding domain-containing protein [Terrimonas sp.]|uniref:NADPH-dependent F420 reductase n=1 Tax=Terrimonas sp. TaxID=1914338 RepID=UPI0009290A27|nr:NAD(P)-binding domain-containing protein [Terrimonas sp.]MBN8787141.1 NAD(P)-binding domain-containing protein [Terrimonas sp.]OJY93165.1 MAG: NADP oxidoreductase [Sphingobacteriales bacterium 40-81]PVD53845.1 NADP oxidoreductase [Terrimonas sp.]
MKTKQTIAIIGASGNMGSAIAKSLSKGNYRLLLYTENTDKVQPVIKEIHAVNPSADVEAMPCSMHASWEADIIIVAVPYNAEKNIAEKIKEVANQKIVISIANPLNNTFNGLVTTPDTSAAEELQQLLPHAKVIKAFNTTFAQDFASPVIDGKKVDAFIAGNDEEALETVAALVNTIGFNPVIAGDLSVSRTLENMQLLLIQLGLKYNYNWHAGWKILHN